MNADGRMVDPTIRVRTWTRGSDTDVRSGLVGFVSLELGPLILDSVTVRRTATGRLALAFPCRVDRRGHKHAIVRPANDAARRAIESAILDQLRQREDLGVAAGDRP